MGYENGIIDIDAGMVPAPDRPAGIPDKFLWDLSDRDLIGLRDQIPAEIMRRLEAIDQHAAVLRGAINTPIKGEFPPIDRPGTAKRGHSSKGGKVAVKYRDEQGNTWSGRGVRPLWLQAAIKAGAALDMFKVGAVQ